MNVFILFVLFAALFKIGELRFRAECSRRELERLQYHQIVICVNGRVVYQQHLKHAAQFRDHIGHNTQFRLPGGVTFEIQR